MDTDSFNVLHDKYVHFILKVLVISLLNTPRVTRTGIRGAYGCQWLLIPAFGKATVKYSGGKLSY